MIEKIDATTLTDCIDGAMEFHSVYEPTLEFSSARFIEFWLPLILSDDGFILAWRDSAGKVVGGIAGIVTKFQTSEALNCVEMFWFVKESLRGRVGLKLIKAFEKEAFNRGCDRVTMAYMENSMPDRMSKLYKAIGYMPYEHHYIKNLE